MPKVRCVCMALVYMKVIGGQWQNTYEGKCPKCNTEWVLANATLEKDEEDELET